MLLREIAKRLHRAKHQATRYIYELLWFLNIFFVSHVTPIVYGIILTKFGGIPRPISSASSFWKVLSKWLHTMSAGAAETSARNNKVCFVNSSIGDQSSRLGKLFFINFYSWSLQYFQYLVFERSRHVCFDDIDPKHQPLHLTPCRRITFYCPSRTYRISWGHATEPSTSSISLSHLCWRHLCLYVSTCSKELLQEINKQTKSSILYKMGNNSTNSGGVAVARACSISKMWRNDAVK